jgi:hypothetical protein
LTYYAAMLNFFKSRQEALVKSVSDKSPIVLAEELLINGPDHYNKPRTRGTRHFERGLIDFCIGDFLTDESSRLIAFKIGRRKLKDKTEFSKKRFKKVEIEDYPTTTILWGAEQQIIFIEKQTRDSIKIDSLINSFQSYLNGLLLAYGWSVSIALKTYESDFWKIVDQYPEIYSVEFTLFAPNFIGDLSRDTKDLLNGIKESYNADETVMLISNKDAKLVLPKNDNVVAKFLSWIALGAGQWAAYVKSNGKRLLIKSTTASRTLNKELDKYDKETAKDFTKKAIEDMNKP